MTRHLLPVLLVACSLLRAEEPLPGHSHQGHAFNEGPRQQAQLIDGTGKVHFPVTTRSGVARSFIHQGVGQLHGFFYYEAERSFRQAAFEDPDCAMAYWGMAMANWENPERAKSFIEKAEERMESATPREQQYFRAQANFLDGDPKEDKNRRQELLHDLEALIHEHPDDLEAKAFLACRIWQFSKKGLPIASHEAVDALLQQVLVPEPLHPAHHYRVHLWDKHKAERALDSAAVLGSTAPAIAHMWHMPNHIYYKLGRYEDAVWHQKASARIDHAHMRDGLLMPDQIHNYAHNNEWLARNWVHLGNADDALAMAKSLLANPRHPKFNSLKGKAHSYRYGRVRLIEILEKFELWEEALLLSQSHWLEPLEGIRNELPRQRLIGLAQYHLSQADYLKETIARVEALGSSSEVDEEGKEKKPSKNDQKKIDKTLAELRGCLAALEGDREAAVAALERSDRPDWAKAREYLALQEPEKADEVSAKAVEKNRNQTLPLAARIEILHSLSRHEDAKKAFEKLRQHSSQLDRSAPPFEELQAIATEYGLPEDWTLPYEVPSDFGERPDFEQLGPLHWNPPLAPKVGGSSRFDNDPRPLILIHFLGHACLHCTEQLNAIADRIDEFEKAGFKVLAISTDTNEDLRLSEENYAASGKPFPIQLTADPDLDYFRAYGAYDEFEDEPLHGTHLISPTGQILWSDISAEPFMDLDFLLNESRRLLEIHAR